MRKEQITGLVVRGDVLEWTSAEMVKGRIAVTGSGRIETEGRLTDSADGNTGGPDAVLDRVESECSVLQGDVAVGLLSENLLLKVVNLPIVEPDELAGMVQLQVDKFSPFPIETMVVSHEVLAKTDANLSVLIAAAQKQVVEALGAKLNRVGIVPARVDSTAIAWWFLLKEDCDAVREGRHVVLVMDGAVNELIVLQNGLPVVFRPLSDITALEGDVMGEEIAREVGYTLLSLELEHKVGGKDSIVVWSRDEAPPRLVDTLRGQFSCDVEVRSLDSVPSVSEAIARRSFVETGGIDLTTDTWRDYSRARVFRKKILTASAAILGVWAVAMGIFFGGLHFRQAKLERLKKQQEDWAIRAMEVRATRRRVHAIRKYTDRTHSSLECLRELSSLLPSGVDLTSFSYKKGDTVRISGEAGTVDLVYDLKSKLDASTLFDEATLQGPTRSRTGKQTFDIILRLPGEE